MPRISALASALCVSATISHAARIAEVQTATDRILMLHVTEGSIAYHKRGEPRSGDSVTVSPLDTAKAGDPSRYRIRTGPSGDAFSPARIHRKSKGTEFAWFVDRMKDGITINDRPDHVAEHWLYLHLTEPIRPGTPYTIEAAELFEGGPATFTFDPRTSRSETLHVNTIGYVPGAPHKFAYLYQWTGDGGSLDLSAFQGKPFHLIDTASGDVAFSGTIAFRMPKTIQETHHTSDSPPHGNFLNADVWECDFSPFAKPGTYVVSVEGIGCSWPFRIADDAYAQPFYHAARALYYNRSGIALAPPHAEYSRPAPHHPKLTPGFAGKLFYTTVRFTEWGSEGGDAKTLKAASKGPLEDTWGWYQDAGDWDGYYSHLRVATELLFAYELRPSAFTDGQLDIPESGNGIPDLLDEAAWLPRYAHRLRHELLRKGWGTGGLGLRVAGDAFGPDEKILPDGTLVGQASWEDVGREWAVSGEDPWSTYRYAGAAAHLAHALRIAGKPDPENVDWQNEAREAFAWAAANTRDGDESKDPPLRFPRAYAAAALFRLTGDPAYETRFLADTADVQPGTYLTDDARYAPWIYALGGGQAKPDPDAYARIKAASVHTAEETVIVTPSKRALRWGGNYFMPMLIGQQTTPWVLEGAVGFALVKDENPGLATRLLAGLYTSCDYFLGTNALNQTWMTRVGPRHPKHVFHMDSWYRDPAAYHPGMIPYSPWRKGDGKPAGPWHQDWPNKTTYPEIDQWPGNERWFSNRCSPMGSEFTVHQNIGPAAAIFGFLVGPAPSVAAEPAP